LDNGSRIISTLGGKTIHIWDAGTGGVLCKLKGHSKKITSVEISQGDAHIISGSQDKTIRIWDAQTGAVLHILKGHSDMITSVRISQDKTRIISGSDDKTIRIWDAQTSAVLHILEGHSNRVTSAAISNDSTRVISGSTDKTIRLWDAQSGTQLYMFSLRPSSRSCGDVRFSVDEGAIVSSGYSFSIPVPYRPSPSQVVNTGHRPLFGLRDGWLMKGDIKVCWIPPDRRGFEIVAQCESAVVMKRGGAMMIIHN